MEMRTYRVRSFDELTDKERDKVICNYININVEHDWWEQVYEDARQIGLEIVAFDIGRRDFCEAKFMASAEETAHQIEKSHGEETDTRQTAENYLKERDEVIDTAERDENGDFVDVYKLDEKLDELDSKFLKDLQKSYLKMLRSEYTYLTSDEGIKETIEAHGYMFTDELKID